METEKRQNNLFKGISGITAVVLILVLDCRYELKTLAAVGITVFYICACFFKWSKEKWTIVLILCISIINVYCDWTIYLPYRITWSAAANKQIGFSTSQLCYTNNPGNADALLCTMLLGRTVSIYGNCNMYQKYFELYSGRILEYNCKQNADFLMEKRENFWDMGRMSLCSAVDCFEDYEVESLKELRQNRTELYQLYLSIHSDEIVDKGEMAVAIDSSHNIYIMTLEEWGELKGD